jgi:carbon-monoxide dehydrogenase medium subunit
MKPPPFDYARPSTLHEAVDLLGRHGPEARVLAGGQSLVPLMKLRLARPTALVDLGRVRELDHVRPEAGALVFGAMARLFELESPAVRTAHPMLAAVAPFIGHRAIRHRGTVGGSLAHADPAAELPVLAVALDAELTATGPQGERSIPAADFFVAALTTSLRPGEILREARFPLPPAASGWSVMELARRHGDYALVSTAVVLEMSSDGTIAAARIALGSVAEVPVRCRAAEAALRGERAGAALIESAAVAAAAPLEPPADVHGSGAYRRRLAEVLVARALAEAWERASASRAPSIR